MYVYGGLLGIVLVLGVMGLCLWYLDQRIADLSIEVNDLIEGIPDWGKVLNMRLSNVEEWSNGIRLERAIAGEAETKKEASKMKAKPKPKPTRLPADQDVFTSGKPILRANRQKIGRKSIT